MNEKVISRRAFLTGSAGLASAAILAACAPATSPPAAPAEATKAPEPTTAPAADATEAPPAPTEAPAMAPTNALGVELPADGLPFDQQRWMGGMGGMEGKYNDYMRSVYDRIGNPNVGQEFLVMADANWELTTNGAAYEWAVADDGVTWTFTIKDYLVFSNGQPIVAGDFEWSMKYALNGKERVYDFAWFYSCIKGATAAVAAEIDVEEVGVKALDDTHLQVVTAFPAPYLPQMLHAWAPLPRDVVEKDPDFWSVDPATYVASGPWTLDKYTKSSNIAWVLNENYKGDYRPWFTYNVCQLGPSSQSATALAAYLAGEISEYSVGGYSAVVSAADMELLNTNRLKDEQHPRPELVSYYLGFNTIDDKWPFKDNLKLRQAFAHAVDVDTLVAAVIPGLAVPLYEMLPPGCVGSKPDKWSAYRQYDPDLAKSMMADAGYPDGAGFPTLTMWVRDPSSAVSALSEAIQKQLQDNLNIELEIRPADYTTFTENLKHEAPLYIVPYGLDFMDQSNMLSIWQTNGRHPWSNADYDAKIDEASGFTGAMEERDAMFEEAQQILIWDDIGAIFLFAPLTIWLYPGNLKGPMFDPNKAGYFSGATGYYSNAYFAKM